MEEMPSEAGREQVAVLGREQGLASSTDAVEGLRWKKASLDLGTEG